MRDDSESYDSNSDSNGRPPGDSDLRDSILRQMEENAIREELAVKRLRQALSAFPWPSNLTSLGNFRVPKDDRI